jgi:short-subunit dehydrogenase
MQQKTALVTGASSGIGYELAKVLAHHDYDLVLVARNEVRLKDVADMLRNTSKSTVRALPLDLSRADAPKQILDYLAREHLEIELLVNNAGFGTYGFFSETDLHTEQQLLQVQVLCLTDLTKLFLKPMLQRGHGRILNVASMAAFQPGPLMAVYSAAKAYILHFTEALANELKETGVSAHVLCPGPVRTNFQTIAGLEDSRLFTGPIPTATETAEAGYRGMMRGKTVIIPDNRNRILQKLGRLAPRTFTIRTARLLLEESMS